MSLPIPSFASGEWLEPDGLGGFASGTVDGSATRRYHALLLAAATPPTGRYVLVNGFQAWAQTREGRFDLTTHRYAPGICAPDSRTRLASFTLNPWPRWLYRLEDGTELEQDLFVTHGAPCAVVNWRLRNAQPGVTLHVRPFLSGRDYHALQKENSAFRFEPETRDRSWTWKPYDGVPAATAISNGAYHHDPHWYRNFLYEEEASRGLDSVEDLAAPGVFTWDLSEDEAIWIWTCPDVPSLQTHATTCPVQRYWSAHAGERLRRCQLTTPLDRAADAYIVSRGLPSHSGAQPNPAANPAPAHTPPSKTVIAGYPWFTDWGRDTFIALRGLCLATGRFEDARAILLSWADTVSEGMLPNRFPDHGELPEYNSVDASLWYIIAVHDYLQAIQAPFLLSSAHPTTPSSSSPATRGRRALASQTKQDRKVLLDAVERILHGYARGTRYGIRMDRDGLLACGEPGVQLTWMDAKVGDWVVTPRSGKPVEIQALWINALRLGATRNRDWGRVLDLAMSSFQQRFWNPAKQCLHDVVDCDHVPGTCDSLLRSNQILAVGGLPAPLIEGARARQIVDLVETRLWTPLGLRSLDREEAGYTPLYVGGVHERDAAYHQGTVWPWLLGPFVEAWVRVRGATAAAMREARKRFLAPLLDHLDVAGLGHISEIADAESPHTPKGCPFQAWSVGEALRLDRIVLAHTESQRSHTSTSPARRRKLIQGKNRASTLQLA